MVVFFFWGPQNQAGISDLSIDIYIWMYWSKVRARTANVSVLLLLKEPKQKKSHPWMPWGKGSNVPIYKSTGDAPIYKCLIKMGERWSTPGLRSCVQPTSLMQILWQVLLKWTLHGVTWWLLLPSRIQLLRESVYLSCNCHLSSERPKAPYFKVISPAPSSRGCIQKNPRVVCSKKKLFSPSFLDHNSGWVGMALTQEGSRKEKGVGFK